jgi:hypothetical protein
MIISYSGDFQRIITSVIRMVKVLLLDKGHNFTGQKLIKSGYSWLNIIYVQIGFDRFSHIFVPERSQHGSSIGWIAHSFEKTSQVNQYQDHWPTDQKWYELVHCHYFGKGICNVDEQAINESLCWIRVSLPYRHNNNNF